MLTAVRNSSTSVPQPVLLSEDSCLAMRKRCLTLTNEPHNGKGVKILYTATVPTKRCRISKSVSGGNERFTVKTAMTPNLSSLATRETGSGNTGIQPRKCIPMSSISKSVMNSNSTVACSGSDGSNLSALQVGTAENSLPTETEKDRSSNASSRLNYGDDQTTFVQNPTMQRSTALSNVDISAQKDTSMFSTDTLHRNSLTLNSFEAVSKRNRNTDSCSNAHGIDRSDGKSLSLPRTCQTEQSGPPDSVISGLERQDNQIQKRCEALKNSGTGSDVAAFENSVSLSKRAIGRNGKSCSGIEGPVTKKSGLSEPRTDTSASNIVKCKYECDSKLKRSGNEPFNAGINNIFTSDIISVLQQFNLTLKSVPAEGKLGESIIIGPVKLRTLVVNNGNSSELKVLSSVDEKYDKAEFRTITTSGSCNTIRFPKPSCARKAALKTTACGTFDNWRINKARSAQSCNCSKTKRADSACQRETERSRRKGFRGNREVSSKCSVNKVTQTLRIPCDLQMKKSLDKAFSDLEARDKAARETLEASSKCRADLSFKTTSDKDLCSLSPTMEDLLSPDRAGYLGLMADPLLTSAAYDNSGSYCDDSIDDLMSAGTQSFPVTPGRHGLGHGISADEVQESEDSYRTKRSKLASEESDFEVCNQKTDERLPCAGGLISGSNDESGSGEMHEGDGTTIRTKRSCLTQELLHDTSLKQIKIEKCEYTNSNGSTVVESKSMNFSSNRNFAGPKGNTPTTRVSSDCSTDKHIAACLKSTEVENWKSNDSLDDLKIDALEAKPLESWSSEEVITWLGFAISRYELKKNSSVENDHEAERSDRVERQNLLGTLYSRIADGQQLRDLTLDNALFKLCADRPLAAYLLEKLQELVSNPTTKGEEMLRGDYCAIPEPPTASLTTSDEELEKSLEYDELLGFNSIHDSSEVDVQSGSYLKSLYVDGVSSGQDMSALPRTCPELHDHFSPFSRSAMPHSLSHVVNSKYGHTHEYASTPLGNHCSLSLNLLSAQSQDISAAAKLNSSCGGQEFSVKSEAFTSHWIPSTSNNSIVQCRPVSPSTYYNVAPVCAPLHLEKEKGVQFDNISLMQPTRKNDQKVIDSRECSMSDDSGIYSPESVFGRHAAKNGVDFSPDFTAPPYSDMSPGHGGCEMLARLSKESVAWMAQSESSEQMQIVLKNIGDEPTRSATVLEAEEAWERASTTSTASTLSTEYETKLLDMDHYKTYYACELTRPNENQCGNVRDTSMCFTKEDSAVAAQCFETFPVSAPSVSIDNKHPQVVTQGSVTTVYPAFIAHVLRSSSASQTLNSALHVIGAGPRQGKYAESIGDVGDLLASDIRGRHGEKGKLQQISGEYLANNSLVGRRRYGAQNVASATYIDPQHLKTRRAPPGKSVHLWEFIRDILLNPQHCPRLIKWEDRKVGIFRFVQSDVVADMWGEKKNNPKMTYEKLSRAMRYYYSRGILERVHGRRLVYKFGKNAYGWRQCGEGNETQCAKRNPTASVEEEVAPELIATPTAMPSKSSLKLKSGTCTVSVSVSDDLIPCAEKRRRLATEAMPSSDSHQKSAETQTPPVISEKITSVQNSIKMKEAKREYYAPVVPSNTTILLNSEQVSGIVSAARPKPLNGDIKSIEVKGERESLFYSNVSKHPLGSLYEQQGKLPSANDLL